jgi:hypothetical protein
LKFPLIWRSPGAPFTHLRDAVPAALAVSAALAIATPAFTATKAQVEPEVIDLGLILEGNEFERFLTVTNVGDEVLIIEDVKTSCGCTAAGIEGSVELESGDSKEVSITFNSRNMDGDVQKKVTVFTNDPEAGSQIVFVKANVHRPVRWSPKYITLDQIGHQDKFEQVATLEADQELGLQVKEAFILGGRLRDTPTKLFDVEISDVESRGDRDAVEFSVRLRPDQIPQRVSETLVAVTNLADGRDTLKLSIRGEIVGRIGVKPAFAVLRLTDPGKEAVRDVMLTASEGTFQVLSAEVEDSPIEVEVFEQNGGTQTVIRLRYLGEEPGSSGVKTLKIRTDDPTQNVIEVPVRYHTRAATKATAQAEEG